MSSRVHRGRVAVVKALIDLLAVILSYSLAFNIRFEGAVPDTYTAFFWGTLPQLLLCRIAGIWVVTRYRPQWHSTSLGDVASMIQATVLGSGVFLTLLHVAGNAGIPRSVALLEWFLSLNALMAVRMVVRVLWQRPQFKTSGLRRSRVLVIGAGDAGQCIVRMIKEDGRANMLPVGFVDDDPTKLHKRIHGVPVLGAVPDIPALVKRRQASQVLIAIPSISATGLNRIVNECARANIDIAIVPGLPQLLNGHSAKHLIRKIRVEDLLERTPVQVNLEALASYLEGGRVLVTGAGGSIGGELCRQIAALRPERLIILGHGENSVFWIDQELRNEHNLAPVAVIADIKDRRELEKVFRNLKPTVVFHAAAHKHVPLMEQNPEEAIKNNVFGTRNLAELSIEYGVERFVMISTDKAVNPTNVMGATKRLAEMTCQAMQQRQAEQPVGTRFVSVRFGNVLGSSGSVIPKFQKQIEAGGPVTVTHPEMVRFFMTIPEAVQLVIQAGAMASDGKVFVLDMGKPVKIMDLARNLIRLSGFTPDRDIRIELTGIRPGEKLFEEVLTAEEGTTTTSHAKIFMARASQINHGKLQRGLDRLEQAVQRSDGEMIKECLGDLIPSYKTSRPAPRMEIEPRLLDPEVERALEEAQIEEDLLAADVS